MSRTEKEGLLARWSRLKRESVEDKSATPAAPSTGGDKIGGGAESEQQPVAHEPERRVEKRGDDAAPQLPPLEELGPDSDFQAFMDPRVDENVRRAALKTLFRDPAFNVTDGLDVYAEDYSKLEKLTPAMVAALRYAQRNLLGDQDQTEQSAREEGSSGEHVNAVDHTESSGVDATAGDGDKEVGMRAVLENSERTQRKQSTEQQGEAGTGDSGTRRG